MFVMLEDDREMAAMASMTIRDDALWAKHVHDPGLRRRIETLAAGEPISLSIDGAVIRFRKMRNGSDGRPTPGLRTDVDDVPGRGMWAVLQARRGETVSVEVAEAPRADPYLAYLDEFLWEWRTPEDAAAFDDL